jgi:hypothetical protein
MGHRPATSQQSDPESSPIAAPPTTSMGQCAPMYMRLNATAAAIATPTTRWGHVSHGQSEATSPTATLVWADG